MRALGVDAEVMVVVDMDARSCELMLVVMVAETQQSMIIVHDPSGNVCPFQGAHY